jgi:hypothetical protein
MVTRPSFVTLAGIAASRLNPAPDKLAKSTLAPMVNRVLTSPYLWWFDRSGGRSAAPLQIPDRY